MLINYIQKLLIIVMHTQLDKLKNQMMMENQVELLECLYKLGAGGLTRAYRQSANEVIKYAKITEVIKNQKYKLEYDYSLNSVVNKYINQKQIHEIKTDYDIYVIKEVATNNNLDDLFDICNGKITIKTDGFIDISK